MDIITRLSKDTEILRVHCGNKEKDEWGDQEQTKESMMSVRGDQQQKDEEEQEGQAFKGMIRWAKFTAPLPSSVSFVAGNGALLLALVWTTSAAALRPFST